MDMMTNCFCFVLLLPSVPPFISSQFLLYYEAAAPAPYRTMNLYHILGIDALPILETLTELQQLADVFLVMLDNVPFIVIAHELATSTIVRFLAAHTHVFFGAFRAELHVSSVQLHMAMYPRSTQP